MPNIRQIDNPGNLANGDFGVTPDGRAYLRDYRGKLHQLSGMPGGLVRVIGVNSGGRVVIPSANDNSPATPMDADDLITNTSAFGVLLSAADDTIQDALDTLDDHVHVHSTNTSLLVDDHTIYALLAGRAGGQSLSGGDAANDDLTLQGTTHGTRTTSYVLLQPNGGFTGIGTYATAPSHLFTIGDGAANIHVTATMNAKATKWCTFSFRKASEEKWSFGMGDSATWGDKFIIMWASNYPTIVCSAQKTGFGGITAPTAMVHLPAGTATASTAPLKFTSGVDLTTPEDGAEEYDGTNRHFTIGSTRKNYLFSGDAAAKVSANDTTPGYLNGKLVAGSGITFTEGSDGGNETLTIARSDGIFYGASTVGTDAYAITPSPAATSYYAGMLVLLYADVVNVTTATINVSSLGVKNILLAGGGALNNGSIQANGMHLMAYDGTQFQLVNQLA